MFKDGNTDFCYVCRKETAYRLEPYNFHHVIDGVEYVVPITSCICSECGSFMNPLGLMDFNTEEYCDWYESRFGVKLRRNKS